MSNSNDLHNAAKAANFHGVCDAVAQLHKSERGRHAVAQLRAFMRDGGNSLDSLNASAVQDILRAAYQYDYGEILGVLDDAFESGRNPVPKDYGYGPLPDAPEYEQANLLPTE